MRNAMPVKGRCAIELNQEPITDSRETPVMGSIDTASVPILSQDQKLSVKFKSTLRHVADADAAYWDYSSIKSNSNPQAYFQYPAMMVPRMQGDIIDATQKVFPDITRTFDPFAGSGTILVESLKRGLSSIAADINPMALLLCSVKTQPFRVTEAEDAFAEVLQAAQRDRDTNIEIKYENRAKWFCPESLLELSRVHRAITKVDDLEMRRLLWVAFAEAVRISSNSRTSTYKLHIRDSEDLERRAIGVNGRITSSMRRVIEMYRTNYEQLKAAGCLVGNHFAKPATVLNHDICQPLKSRRADALISSPPYGDNHTTIPYGQHSFLPLCWIPIEDIDPTLEPTLLANTHAIDSASLGGRREGTSWKKGEIFSRSKTLAELLDSPAIPKDAQQRLISFFYDLDQGFTNALSVLKPRAPIVLTLGNRSVSGRRVQTDQIVQDLLVCRGCEFIDTHARAIPVKRMAHRNKNTDTMLTETLLVMRGPKS
jgi:hypothetical protein